MIKTLSENEVFKKVIDEIIENPKTKINYHVLADLLENNDCNYPILIKGLHQVGNKTNNRLKVVIKEPDFLEWIKKIDNRLLSFFLPNPIFKRVMNELLSELQVAVIKQSTPYFKGFRIFAPGLALTVRADEFMITIYNNADKHLYLKTKDILEKFFFLREKYSKYLPDKFMR